MGDKTRGLKIIREQGINLTVFKRDMAEVLNGTQSLNEDEWAFYYNNYADFVGNPVIGFETVSYWAKEVLEDCNIEDDKIQLK